MRRIAYAVLLVTLHVLLATHRVEAYETWCADDPVIMVGGRIADIQLQMPATQVAAMRSTALVVTVPRNVAGTVLIDDVSAFPMQTTILPLGPTWDGNGAIPITVIVQVDADAWYPIRVVITPASKLIAPTAATGTTNQKLFVPAALG